MSTDERTQILQEIDFCASRLPYLWDKHKNGSKGVRQSYGGIIQGAFIMLDAAVARLMALEGLQRLPVQDASEGKDSH